MNRVISANQYDISVRLYEAILARRRARTRAYSREPARTRNDFCGEENARVSGLPGDR